MFEINVKILFIKQGTRVSQGGVSFTAEHAGDFLLAGYALGLIEACAGAGVLDFLGHDEL